MAIPEQLKTMLVKLKDFWSKLSTKLKIIIVGGAAVILVGAIVITAVMNANADKFSVLFSGITTSEATEVYALLQEQGVDARMNNAGQVTVPTGDLDRLIFNMAAEGYPKSAPPYDVYLKNVGPTTTESTRRQLEIFSLQSLLQSTLAQIEGVKKATVLISMPKDSGLVLQVDKTAPTASVMLTLSEEDAISASTVDTIKSLVANAVGGNCKPENVFVTDALTSININGTRKENTAYSMEQFDYEQRLATRAEDAIKRLYTPAYTVDGVRVSASYELDTDKMKQESRTVNPTDGSVKSHEEETFISNGGLPPGGVVGEEENTDVPNYAVNEEATTEDLQEYSRSTDWENEYVLTQIERGNAPIKNSSITVLVNETNLTPTRQDEIVAQVAKATGIEPTNVSVGVLSLPPVEDVGVAGTPFYQSPTFIMGVGGLLLLLCAALIVIPVIMSRKKKRKAAEAAAAAALLVAEQEDASARAQAEIDMHKNKLKLEAETQKVENSMTEEIRSFAKENPEMTALLIRSLIKED